MSANRDVIHRVWNIACIAAMAGAFLYMVNIQNYIAAILFVIMLYCRYIEAVIYRKQMVEDASPASNAIHADEVIEPDYSLDDGPCSKKRVYKTGAARKGRLVRRK